MRIFLSLSLGFVLVFRPAVCSPGQVFYPFPPPVQQTTDRIVNRIFLRGVFLRLEPDQLMP